MKQEFYDRLAAPFEASERKKNCLLRVNHILTDVVYLDLSCITFLSDGLQGQPVLAGTPGSGGDLCAGESVPQEV